jgi:hypothetical protein
MNILSIILIILGLIILLFIIFFIIYKKRKSKRESSLFGQGFLEKISVELNKIGIPNLSEKNKKKIYRGKRKTRGFFRGIIRTLDDNYVKKKKDSVLEIKEIKRKKYKKYKEDERLKGLEKEIKDKIKDYDKEDDEERKKRLKERVDVNAKDFGEVIKNIDDPHLTEVVKIFDERRLINFTDKDITLETKKDVEEFVKQKIFEYLENRKNMLYEKVSELRKKGADTRDIDFEIMALPLKIRVFQATLRNRDSDKILEMIQNLNKGIKKLEKEFNPEKSYEQEEAEESEQKDKENINRNVEEKA